MISPPRNAERLLESLGATPECRDTIVGDLAEEFAERTECDGVAAARRWYYRECVRVIPHLLRNWLRRARSHDFSHIAGVALSSYVFLSVIGLVIVGVAHGVAASLGVRLDLSQLATSHVVLAALALPLGAASAVTGGYIAALLSRRAPLLSAVALGLGWSGVSFGVLAALSSAPIWYRIVAPLIVIIGTTVGGVARVLRSESLDPSAGASTP
jgi:hypothetical protein